MAWIRWSLVLIVGPVLIGCQTHNYTQRGAAVGGLGGAGLGAVLGEIAGDKPLAGAAVGSAVGALTGASVGNALDEIDARNEQRVQQAAYAGQAYGLSIDEIVAMSQSGLSDDVISRHIRRQGFQRPLDTADLIALRQQGVSDRVISALQEATSVSAPSEVHVAAPVPIYVEERLHGVPCPPYPRWRYRAGVPCPPGPRFHWGFSYAK